MRTAWSSSARQVLEGRPQTLALPFVRHSALEERVRELLGSFERGAAPRAILLAAGLLTLSAVASALVVRAPELERRQALEKHGGGAAVVDVADEVAFLELPSNLAALRLSLACDLTVVPAADRVGLLVRATDPAPSVRFLERLEVERGPTWRVRDPNVRHDGSISVELHAHPGLALDAVVHVGDLSCSAVLGSLDATVSLGSLELSQDVAPPGPINVHVSRGALRARLPRVTEGLRASGGLADVDVSLFEPNSSGVLHVTTGRGDTTLRMPDPTSPRLEAYVESGYGDVTIEAVR